MKKQFADYLSSIGIKELFLKRAKEVINFYQENIADNIEHIFVNDYIDEQGNRHYESLWLFTEYYMMEAKQFLTKDEFDIAPNRY